MTSPKVFGNLYIAVFSNGTVKAGMAKSRPQDRVTSHAHSGKAFGIGMEAAFYASIYTTDTRARERLMHQEISELAVLTAGREWFKFSSVDVALNFASAYLCKVERMSFAERPSIEEIAKQVKYQTNAVDRLLNLASYRPEKAFTFSATVTESELDELASVMDGYSLPVVASIASKIVCQEEMINDPSKGEESKTPALTDVINTHFSEHDRICTLNGVLPTEADESHIAQVVEQGHPYSKCAAIKIIQAAAKYPDFFFQVMRSDPPALFGGGAA